MTLGRDIIPRFQKTPNYTRMNQMLDDLKTNNGPNDLIVPPPDLPANPITDDLSYRYSLDVLSSILLLIFLSNSYFYFIFILLGSFISSSFI